MLTGDKAKVIAKKVHKRKTKVNRSKYKLRQFKTGK